MGRSWRWPWKRNKPAVRSLSPVLLRDQLAGLHGQWVAIKDGKVVGAKATPDALRLYLHEHDIVGSSIMRVPDLKDPELVGVG